LSFLDSATGDWREFGTVALPAVSLARGKDRTARVTFDRAYTTVADEVNW
jgi:hypothetical protein